MSESTFALNGPFTLEQVTDSFRTLFNQQGWGTGLTAIQGGYQVSSAQAADSVTAPIRISANGSVTKPASVDWLESTADWADNFHGGNLVYPVPNGNYLAKLLFWLPGLKRFRIAFTPLYRPAGGTTGNFSDLDILAAEANFAQNISSLDSQYRRASMKDSAWGSTYTVGQQYVSKWSHGAGGAITAADRAEFWAHAELLVQNVVLRIDYVEYELDVNRFAVQAPNLEGGVWEFIFRQNVSLYGIASSYPLKNPKRARVLLKPPMHRTVSGTQFYQRVYTYFYNLFRDDNASTLGFTTGSNNQYWVTKNGSFNSTLNALLASNADKKGFFLRVTQSGMSDYHLCWDTVDKASSLPAVPQNIPERMARVTIFNDTGTNNTYTPSRLGALFQVRGSSPITLKKIYIGQTWGGSGTVNLKLYSVTTGTGTGGKTLLYQSKVADVPVTLSGGTPGYAVADNLNLSLPPGYYVLTLNNINYVGPYGHPYLTSNNGSVLRLLGGIQLRDTSSEAGWVAGTTQLNLTADNYAADLGGAQHITPLPIIELQAYGGETPSQQQSAYGEGVAVVVQSAYGGSADVTNLGTIGYVQNASSPGDRYRGPGVALPAGIDARLSTVLSNAFHYQTEPLPGWGTYRGDQSTAHALPALEFDNPTPPDVYDVWVSRPYAHPFRLQTLKLRRGNSVAPGGHYVVDASTKDFVFGTLDGGGSGRERSLCFRSVT